VLDSYNLRVNKHPELLLCTLRGCTTDVPLEPYFSSVERHLKTAHVGIGVNSGGFDKLKAAIEAAELRHPADVEIDSRYLPVPVIPELELHLDGYRCIACSYAVKARASIYAHVKAAHPDAVLKDMILHPAAVQLIHSSGQNKRYVHVSQSRSNQVLPPGCVPYVQLANNAWVSERVRVILKREAALINSAGLDNAGIQPEAELCYARSTLWMQELGWPKYWAGKPVAALGNLGTMPQHWPGKEETTQFLGLGLVGMPGAVLALC
jgi:hypothetical protein